MSGILSGKGPLTNIRYVGNLSRFIPQPPQEKKYDVLLLLSGPEPQRSLLEQNLIGALRQSPLKSLVVRGKPGSSEYLQDSYSMTIKIICTPMNCNRQSASPIG
ncbi:hypothetical protein EMGBS15_05770 [Filimonas sp.]|nr:hypothetical protein EMGBS15_05770 [Filimonas sp.]